MVKLSFLGDIFPANLSYNRGLGVASLPIKQEETKYIDLLQRLIGERDFVVGNLESPILSNSDFSKDKQFAGNIDFIRMLKKSGVDLVTIANNHIREYGLEGVENTKKVLNEEGILFVGSNDVSSNTKFVRVWQDGLSLGFLAYNDIDNHRYDDNLISEYSKYKILSDICRVKSEVDYLFLLIHWGDEYIHRPSYQQQLDAHAFVDAGAKFVICSHPHVIQPIEEYNNGLICYSLGNFIFDMTIPSISKYGMILDLDLDGTTFSYKSRFVELQKNFFPKLLVDDSFLRSILSEQTKLMQNVEVNQYIEDYNKEKKKRRNIKRIKEKVILLRNWFKYSPEVRKDFINIYLEKIKKCLN